MDPVATEKQSVSNKNSVSHYKRLTKWHAHYVADWRKSICIHLRKKSPTGLELLYWDMGWIKLKCVVPLLQGKNKNSRSRSRKVINIFSERQEYIYFFFSSSEFLAKVGIISIIQGWKLATSLNIKIHYTPPKQATSKYWRFSL